MNIHIIFLIPRITAGIGHWGGILGKRSHIGYDDSEDLGLSNSHARGLQSKYGRSQDRGTGCHLKTDYASQK